MCDQTEVSYGDGDVVWVKIGPIWWPGVVKDVQKEGKEEEVLGGLRQKPIATVQFFDEDKYEFVKNLENIYHYNCRKKEEFLRKGLDKFRTGAKHMTKFPDDVKKAEELVNGDVNIIDDPRFAPVEKSSYNDIFGTPKPKKKKTEELTLKTKFLPLKKRLSTPGHYRPLSQMKPRSDVSTPRRSGPLVEAGAEYFCPFCDFTGHFIDSISWHVSLAHSARRVNYGPENSETKPYVRAYSEPKKPRSAPTIGKKKGRSAKSKDTPVIKVEKKAPVEKTPLKRPAQATEKPVEKKKKFTDALLADWSEDDDFKDDEKEENEAVNHVEEVVPVPPAAEEPKNEVREPEPEPSTADLSGALAQDDVDKKENPSCFDFEDEDDGFIGMSNANTYGRKIPRVIPLKDKTDLGMDLEIDELFKRKPDSEHESEEEVETPVKKRRGRPPLNPDAPRPPPRPPAPKKLVKVETPKDGLAATRERRPGARKSYLKEVIEKVDETGAIIKAPDDDELPKPSSRRKQDLKKQSLRELEDVDINEVLKRKEEEDSLKLKEKREKDLMIKLSKKEDDEFLTQVESLLAETESPSIPLSPPKPQPVEEEFLDGSVEYLEDDPEPLPSPPISPIKIQTPVKLQPPIKIQSPVKRWKDDIRAAISETTVKKVIPQWKQNISEALKAQSEKTVVIKPSEPVSNVVKMSKLTRPVIQQKGGTYYIVKQPSSRPQILGKPQPQQVMLVTNQRNVQQRVKVVKSDGSPSSPSSPVVQLISDGKGGVKKVALSKKVIQIGGGNSSTQKYVISGKGHEGGAMRLIENYNGTGKTVIVKESGSGSSGGHKIMGVRKTVGSVSGTGEKRQQCVLKGIKGADGKYTIQRIVKSVRKESSGGERSLTIPQHRQHTIVMRAPEPVQEPAPIVEQHVIEQPQIDLGGHVISGAQQVVAVPGPDGSTTYMLVTMNDGGLLQAVDSNSLQLSYEVQPEVTNQIYQDDLTPVYSSAGQDILAEALANTNVLESEMPLMLPSIVQETVALQKPIMTPLEIPSTVIPDTSTLLISPVVQETATLQKPIMTPVEVPTSIVPDTSGLEPPPLPPTPTEEDVLMEADEGEGSLMIAEQQVEQSEGDLMIAEQSVEQCEEGLVIAEESVQEEEARVIVEQQEQHEEGALVMQQQQQQEEGHLVMQQEEGELVIQHEEGELVMEEQPMEQLVEQDEQQQHVVTQAETNGGPGDFFIDDSQEGEEVNSFQSMPLLNEESTASEEPIGNQSFEVQQAIVEAGEYIQETEIQAETVETSEYLPTSTNPDLEPDRSEEVVEESVVVYQEEIGKEGETPTSMMPFLAEDGFAPDEGSRSQETEVSSTTRDSVP